MKRKIRGFRLILAALMSVMLILSSSGVTVFADEHTPEPDTAVTQVNEGIPGGSESTSGNEESSGSEESFEDEDLISDESSYSGTGLSSDEESDPDDVASPDEESDPDDIVSPDEESDPDDVASPDEESYPDDSASPDKNKQVSEDETPSEEERGAFSQEYNDVSEEDTFTTDGNTFSYIPAEEEELSEEAEDSQMEEPSEHFITIDSSVYSNLEVKVEGREDGFSAYPDDLVTVTAMPTIGYSTASITVKMSSDDTIWNEDYAYDVPDVSHPDRNTITFAMPNANVYLTADFFDYNHVSVFICDMEGGTVTADRYVAGTNDTVYLTIQPDNGYTYVNGSLAITEPDNPDQEHTLAILSSYPEDDGSYRLRLYGYSVNVTAEFEAVPIEETYAVTLPETVEHGTLTADCTEAAEGWTVTLTAHPEAQSYYLLESLTVTAESGTPVDVEVLNEANGTYTFVMPGEPVSVSAVFSIPSYTVTAVSEDPTGLGSKIVDTFDDPVPYGDTVFVSLLVMEGGELVSLTAVGDSGTEFEIGRNEQYYTFTMPAEPVTLTAVFGFVDYIIDYRYDISSKGTFTVSTGGDPVSLPATVHKGDTLTVTNTLKESDGAIVSRFIFRFYDSQSEPHTVYREAVRDGLVFSCSFELNWPSDVIIEADYTPANAVYFENTGQGKITADKPLAITDETVTLTIEPESGWELTGLTIVRAIVNGETPVDFTENADGTVTFVMPENGVTVAGVFTSTEVPYINAAGTGDTATVSFVKNTSTEWSGNDVWLAVMDEVTIESRVMVSGNVNLILCDGAVLKPKLGIGVPEGSSLTIWVQENGTGALIANIYSDTFLAYDAAIGGTGVNGVAGAITIYGGHLSLDGGFMSAAIGAAYKGGFNSVAIHGGTIDLNPNSGGSASGIGAGTEGADGGSITITDGTVTAKTGGWGRAAIGGPGASIDITGGIVTATGTSAACGIGGKGATVTISGGTVSGTAASDISSSGIGGESAGVSISGGAVSVDAGNAGIGLGGENATVEISGGTITAIDSQHYGGVASLGGENCKTYLDWDESRPITTLNVHQFGGEVYLLRDFNKENYEGSVFKATGRDTPWSDVTLLQDITLVPTVITIGTVPYINASGAGDEAEATFVKGIINEWSGIDVWYAVVDNVTIDSRVAVSGDVNLILCDGATLTAKLGISVPEGSSLTVWVQENGTGALLADVQNSSTLLSYYAAIGGTSENGDAGDAGEITIYGGHLTLDSSYRNSAIGSANGGSFTSVAVHGGTIDLNLNGGSGTGIGSSRFGTGSGSITITDGTVTAKTGDVAIGGPATSIEITGGIVTATTNGASCGIGGEGALVTISGGTVSGKATNSHGSVGIGGKNAAVTVTGGTVHADGDTGGVGIGGENATVEITGGNITAVDSQYWGGVASLGGENCKTYLNWDESRPITTLNVHQFGGEVYLLRDFIEEDQEETVFSATGGETPWSDVTQLQDKTLVPAVVRSAVTIKGVTGSFNDKIKLNYYFDIPAAVLVDEAAYVTLTNESSGSSSTLLVKDAEFIQNKGYKFSILLAAKEASDTITAKVYDGQGSAIMIRGNLRDNNYTETGVRYTLMQYFAWLEKSGETDKEKALGAAAKDYCAAAQIYFNYNADGLELSGAVSDVTAEMLNSYIAVRSGTLPAGVSIRGISSMLESDNTLRLYLGFKGVDPSGFTCSIDKKAASLKQRSDGAYYLALDTGVYSNHLQDTHTYSVSDGTDTCSITMSVLTYARSCAIKSRKEESDLGKVLYLYNQAAAAVFGD